MVNYIENALQSGLAAKERKDAFSIISTSESQHMSFYIGDKVKSVNGKTTYEAITKALADLHEDFRENASIYMRYAEYVVFYYYFAEYVDIITTLANGSTALFEATPEKYLVNQLSLQMLQLIQLSEILITLASTITALLLILIKMLNTVNIYSC